MDNLGARAFLLHLGIFVLFVPLIILERSKLSGPSWLKAQDPWAGKPTWAVRSIQAVGLLFFVIFFVFFFLSHAASPEIKDGDFVLNSHGDIVGYITEKDYRMLKAWELRLFASGWTCFYYAIAISWWFPRVEETPWAVDP